MSPGRAVPLKLLSMSLSTQGLTFFVLFICSSLGGLSGAHEFLPGPATGCRTPVWLEAGPGGSGVVGESSEPRPLGSRHSSVSGCQMTVVGAAAGTPACARGTACLPHALMGSGLPEECSLASTRLLLGCSRKTASLAGATLGPRRPPGEGACRTEAGVPSVAILQAGTSREPNRN